MDADIKVRAQRGAWNYGTEFMFVGSQDGNRVYGRVTYEVVKEDAVKLDPSFTLGDSAAQLLMDDLWQAGFRPSEGTGSAGALAATQKHLEDMRTVAFKYLGMGDNE